MSFEKFTKIGKLSDAVYLMRRMHPEGVSVKIRGKVKIHGTNAGIRVAGGEITAQSRNRDLFVGDDNYGFAMWVKELGLEAVQGDVGFVIYGEWAGKGIQNGVASSKMDGKTFFIFAIKYFDDGLYVDNPFAINRILELRFPTLHAREDVEVIPWYTDEMEISTKFEDAAALQEVANAINQMVEVVDAEDPYIKELYGIEGHGEGIVFTPAICPDRDKLTYSDLVFKAKGASHQTQKVRAPVTIDPETVKAGNEFARSYVTETRLLQGVESTKIEYSLSNMGTFLKWLSEDIRSESEVEREANPELPEWKKLSKVCSGLAVQWFKQQCEKI